MEQQLYTFKLAPNWKLINQISGIDRFGGAWAAIERREGQTLRQLKSIATVRSVGASTRIEGSKLSDDEVEALIGSLQVSIPEQRDQQEVAGYFEALDAISESYRDIDITEGNLKNLHNLLMKYSEKDVWHKGRYKQVSNEVEATHPNGTKHTIFKTSAPGFDTEEAMQKLVAWYKTDLEVHPLVRAATFIYDFLSIHPFQDGNGRLSRLLATLLLLKQGYSWIEYVSFEHEIENRKSEYYKVLMNCQRQRPGEDIHDWMLFFLDCLANIQTQLMQKLEAPKFASSISVREKKIYQYIENHPGAKSVEISAGLNIALPTIKRILTNMVNTKLLQKHGTGTGTHYSIKPVIAIKKDLLMRFTNTDRSKGFLLNHDGMFIEIKKIILTPKFDWIRPDDWVAKLFNEGLFLQITVANNKGGLFEQPYTLTSFNNPFLFQPVFTLTQPISIPSDLSANGFFLNEYPLQVTVKLLGSVEQFSFDVLVVYDEGTFA